MKINQLKFLLKVLFKRGGAISVTVVMISVAIGMAFFCSKPRHQEPLWQAIAMPTKSTSTQEKLSNYERMQREQNHGEQKKHKLLHKAALARTNPFSKLFETAKDHSSTQTDAKKHKPIQKVTRTAATSSTVAPSNIGFFEVKGPAEEQQEAKFYKAIFRETQHVLSGKTLKITLQEAIPALRLEAGSVLKGVPTCVGERIHIQITAGQVGDHIFKLALLCFDSEDLQEGIYHDQVARQFAETAKESILDEVLELDFKGNQIARKAHRLTKINQTITIEKGKQIFVALPSQEGK